MLSNFFSRREEKTPLLEKKTSVMQQHLMYFKVGNPRENGNNFTSHLKIIGVIKIHEY